MQLGLHNTYSAIRSANADLLKYPVDSKAEFIALVYHGEEDGYFCEVGRAKGRYLRDLMDLGKVRA